MQGSNTKISSPKTVTPPVHIWYLLSLAVPLIAGKGQQQLLWVPCHAQPKVVVVLDAVYGLARLHVHLRQSTVGNESKKERDERRVRKEEDEDEDDKEEKDHVHKGTQDSADRNVAGTAAALQQHCNTAADAQSQGRHRRRRRPAAARPY